MSAQSVNAYFHQVTRPACTLLVVGTYCGLAIVGTVSADAFKDICLIVVGFWFAQRGADARASDYTRAIEATKLPSGVINP